ncbi:hypothetical protein NPIL_511631 [Nephila pilipes]|uniref:Uncharacterized protein n=1 Tax=Nephila pilipes TaxID=299642 RepID=A0A8X6QJ30_NEPPI|nr:hypothetical protein NPIL_511631 [Nephila pilipes]
MTAAARSGALGLNQPYTPSPPPSHSTLPKKPIKKLPSTYHQPMTRQPTSTSFYLARSPQISILLILPIHQSKRSLLLQSQKVLTFTIVKSMTKIVPIRALRLLCCPYDRINFNVLTNLRKYSTDSSKAPARPKYSDRAQLVGITPFFTLDKIRL